MGIIKATGTAVSGTLADQWLETIEPEDMGDKTVFTKGVLTRQGQNKKGTSDYITDGSHIRVYDNQCMLLVCEGKVVDYTAEPGAYIVDNQAQPSVFNGGLKAVVKEVFERIKYGGQPTANQQVFYINLQEIKGIKFGTKNPVNYFDCFYNAELFLRAHGTYSIKITNPLQFYTEVIPRNAEKVEMDAINEQYLSEFLEALQAAINQMSADGQRISYVSSKARELGKYMADTLDEDWEKMRGMQIQSVGVASITYDEKSQELINMRNEGAMLSDPTVREGYMQGHMARGMEAAGGNANGSMAGFMGMGMAGNVGGNVLGAASESNLRQMQMEQANANPTQTTSHSQTSPTPQTEASARTNDGNRADAETSGAKPWFCPDCGHKNFSNFCSECGKARP